MLIATFASVIGNEAAFLFGRRRLIAVTMIVSAVCAVLLGFVGPQAYIFAAALLLGNGLAQSRHDAFARLKGRPGKPVTT